ncbi:MAG: Glu/Leu/Phe/Val dehydrogenase dimerization domain-containing protein [Candidatus Saccharimonadales bacterium]
MALETLIDSQSAAAEIMDIDYAEMKECQEPELVMVGSVAARGQESVAAYRAHSGDSFRPDLIAKGGIRMFSAYRSDAEARATVKELAVEMYSKLALRGHSDGYKGGKGLIVADSRLPFDTRVKIIQDYEHLMEDAGLAGPYRYVPAGDIGTNGLADAYALEYHKSNPSDPLWRAIITGKYPENGGLEFRSAATGWGTFITQSVIMAAKGHNKNIETAIQGFGNVGGWHAYFASSDPSQKIRINAISDSDGTLFTSSPNGLKITREMVEQIADNPKFTGQKIHALQAALGQTQPGLETKILAASDILTCPTDYFVPAAMGNVINHQNVGKLGARYGIIEAANGPTTKSAHHYLVKHGQILVVPDIVANGAGVDCSIKERDANLDIALNGGFAPSTEVVQKQLAETSKKIVNEVLTAANNLQTQDLRIAAAAIAMGHVLSDSHPGLLGKLLS